MPTGLAAGLPWHHRGPDETSPMKRLLQAPNLALATLWADQLTAAGIGSTVQRSFNSSLAGQIPPDQCLPEVWVDDADQHDTAKALLEEWRRLPHRVWACPGCHEIVEGPFEQCWNCGAPMPPPR
jgi:Putative prokaryotic signal transducing protein